MSHLQEAIAKIGSRLRQLMARTDGELDTIEKANLVAAINELAARPSPSTGLGYQIGDGLGVVGNELRLNIAGLSLAPEN